MWGDREPLYNILQPMISLVDVVILVHRAGNLSDLQVRYRLRLHLISITRELFPVVSAEGLAQHDVFRLPDPFAIVTVDSERRYITSVIEKTLDPFWNEHFDV